MFPTAFTALEYDGAAIAERKRRLRQNVEERKSAHLTAFSFTPVANSSFSSIPAIHEHSCSTFPSLSSPLPSPISQKKRGPRTAKTSEKSIAASYDKTKVAMPGRIIRQRQGVTPMEALPMRPGGKQTIWAFMLDMLMRAEYCDIIGWTGEGYKFKIYDREEFVRLWSSHNPTRSGGTAKWTSITRGLRKYYNCGVYQDRCILECVSQKDAMWAMGRGAFSRNTYEESTVQEYIRSIYSFSSSPSLLPSPAVHQPLPPDPVHSTLPSPQDYSTYCISPSSSPSPIPSHTSFHSLPSISPPLPRLSLDPLAAVIKDAGLPIWSDGDQQLLWLPGPDGQRLYYDI